MSKNYLENFNQAYKSLNKQQKEAVDSIEGPVVVVAGPGTGKTQILTLRIANILNKLGGQYAENILALTFTNAGVYAMRKRLSEIVGAETASRVSIYTFHSFCEDQIKNNQEIFPSFVNSKVISDLERINFIESILKNNKEVKILKTFASTFHYSKKIISAISKLKQEGVSPELFFEKIIQQEKDILADESSYYKRDTAKNKKGDVKDVALKPILKNKELQLIYVDYQKKLEENNLYDFSDMILSVVEKLKNDPEYLTLVQEKFLYLLVDEHQDTNDSQNILIEKIASAEHLNNRPNIFTVGDQKQAIYRFQGASIENFSKFKDFYDDTKIIELENNYRSSQHVLDFADEIIKSDNPLKSQVKFKEDLSININSFSDYNQELVYLCEKVSEKIKDGVNPEEIAIFYRENKNLDSIKEILEKFDLSYNVFSKENILSSKIILKLVLLLKAVQNPLNSEILAECLFIDFLNIDTFDALKVLDKFKKIRKNKFLFKIISDENILDELEIVNKESILSFSDNISKMKKYFSNNDFLLSFEKLLHDFSYIEHILSLENNRDSLAKLESFFTWLKKDFVSDNDNPTLDKLTNYIDILNRHNISIDSQSKVKTNSISLMTTHSAKGLEFEYVFLVNFVDSVWGGKRNITDFSLPINSHKNSEDDEKRLFYVAATRAKKEFSLFYSTKDSQGKDKIPSRFLDLFSLQKSKEVEADYFERSFRDNPILLQRKNLSLKILDLDYIKEEFLKMPLTVSALNNYFRSPLIYFFRNFLKIPSVQNRTLLYGSLVHKVLELYFKNSKEENGLLSKEQMLEILDKEIDNFDIYDEDFDDVKHRAVACLSDYFDYYHKDFTLEIETEKFVKAVPLSLDDNQSVILRGIVDKIEIINDNRVRVVDYKTGKAWSEKDKSEKESLKRQIVFYKLLLEGYMGGKYTMEEGVLDFVEKNKKGEYEKVSFVPTIDEVLALKNEIREFSKDIISGAFLEKEYIRDDKNSQHYDFFKILKNK